MTNELLGEAGRLWCDEGWAIDDESPGWVYQRGGGPGSRGERRDVGESVWWLMRAIRYGVGYAGQKADAQSRPVPFGMLPGVTGYVPGSLRLNGKPIPDGEE